MEKSRGQCTVHIEQNISNVSICQKNQFCNRYLNRVEKKGEKIREKKARLRESYILYPLVYTLLVDFFVVESECAIINCI